MTSKQIVTIVLASGVAISATVTEARTPRRGRGCVDCFVAEAPAQEQQGAGPAATPAAASNTTAAKPVAQHEWKSLFDGKTLKGWKETQFVRHGKTEVKDGVIVLDTGDDLTGVTWTGEHPKTNYEIELDAMKIDGSDFFCGLTFPVAEDSCSLICGGWGGTIGGLSTIDGEDAATNETTFEKTYEKDRWYHIRVEIRPRRIRAWIDDEKVVDVDTGSRKVSVRWEVEPSQPLGIATYRTKGAVKNIQWRQLGAE